MLNEIAKIILAATHAKLSKVTDAYAVEGTINALKCEFQFRTPDWDNTNKTAVFVRGRATPSTINEKPICVILDENNECDVPSEILVKEGVFSVGVFGTKDNYRIVSNWICYKIDNGCYADGSTPIDPSSTIYEQIISMLNNKLENKLDKNLGENNSGKVLAVGNNGDVEPQLLDTGIVVLSGTDDNPINIDEIKTSGTYLIKGTVTTSMDTTSGSDSAKLNKIFMDGFACGELMSVYSLQDGFINQFMMNSTRPLVRLDSGEGYSDAIDVSYIQPVETTTEMTQPVGIRRDGQLFTKPFNQVQSDWNQNDENANGYIKNRTHYTETNKQLVTSGTWVLTLGDGTDLFILSKTGLSIESFSIGDIYELKCVHNNGNTYKFKLKATQTNEIRARIIYSSGNIKKQIDPSGADLVIQIIDGSLSVVAGGECNYLTGESSVEVYRIQENIHQIDSKYLPGKQIHIINTNDNMTSIDLTELESGLYYLDNSIEIPVLRQQDGEDITYDYYYLESNSIISVSNFDSGGYITSFTYSYTYEWECDDSGNRVFLYAYANDGFGGKDADKLIGRQGVGNNAEIFNDYEENEAIGNYSHVEGHKGFGSGFAAHVEGDCCCAYGPVSHAEGVGTIAEASAQHVQGQFNIPDENWAYAHIVGNGFNDSERSNAHTLDWLGNAWFAGNIKIGGTSRHDAAAKTIATTDDIDASKPKSATITLLAANWVGDASPYSQVITIPDATANTMIDLLPTPAQLAEFQANEITLMMVNDDGVVTAYALNAKPTQDYEIPMVITETR